MPTAIVVSAVLVVVAIVVVLAVRSSRAGDPVVRRYLAFATQRGWARVSPDVARDRLGCFTGYVESAVDVRVAVAGSLAEGQGLSAVLDQRDGAGRSWFVAVVERADLAGCAPVQMDPRAVRTVRVMDVLEVQVDDARMGRGWRLTSSDHADAEEWLHTDDRAKRVADVLHRPHPWVFGVRVCPGAVAVHLARREDRVADLDDLDRLVTLAADVAAALAGAPAGVRADEDG